MPARTIPSPVSIADMKPLGWSVRCSHREAFSSIEMATCLDISAQDCREALEYFVQTHMLTFAGTDSEGIEHWELTKTGYRVWSRGRIGFRLTSRSIKSFLAYMQVVTPALVRRPEVVRVVVSGAWVDEKTHGPFIIGICVKEGATTIGSELQMIQDVLQIATAGDFLEADAPVVMVYTQYAQPPQSLQIHRVAYERGQEPILDLTKAPYESFVNCTGRDQPWDSRLLAYAGALKLTPLDESLILDVWDLASQPERFREMLLSIPDVPLAKQLVHRELECCRMPTRGVDSPYAGLPLYERDMVHSTDPDHTTLKEIIRFMPRTRGSFYAPDWQKAVATADYFWHLHAEEMFDAAAYAKKLLDSGNWYFARMLHPTLKQAPAKALLGLAATLNEARMNERQQKQQRQAERPKTTTVNAYYALFDISFEEPRCVALVRQPTGNQGNLRNARSEYLHRALRSNPDARATYQAGFAFEVLALMERTASPEEIEAFERLAKQLKRAVSYIIDFRGEAIIGFKGHETTQGASPLNFRSLPEGALKPLILDEWEFNSVEKLQTALPENIYNRLNSWWVCPERTSAADAAKACVQGPAISRLARIVNPDGIWTFQAMDDDPKLFSASMVGTGWAIRLENIGHKTIPPTAVCQFGAEAFSSQLVWDGDRSWKPKYPCFMPQLTVLLKAYHLLELIGLQSAMEHVQLEDFGDGAAPEVSALQRYEALMNLVVTGHLFRRARVYELLGSFFYEASFGSREMREALTD